MRIGLDSYSFQIALAAGTYDPFAALDTLEALGLTGIQININGPRGRFLGGEIADRSHVRRVRAELERRGFFAEIGGAGTAREALEPQLRLCAEIGADVLRTLLVFRGNLDETLETARRDLEASLPLARELGVRIALENHEDVTAGELLACLEQIDDPWLGACLDTGNDLVLCGDPVQSAQSLSGRTLTTHIKDQKLVRVAGTVYSVGVPLGTGDVDLPSILRVIRGSDLKRILIQDTTGYAAPLNPFGRTDVPAPGPFGPLPEYASEKELLADGMTLSLEGLAPQELRSLAAAKDAAIAQDVTYVRTLLSEE